MKHRIGFNKLSKNVSHRQALYRSMATALFKYERIKTTKPKAREIRRVAEKMISRARTDSVHNRRIIGKRIKDKAVLAKLFTDIAPRFASRPGGYTRILKLGQRYGDASEMVLLELVERAEAAPRRRRKETAKAEAEPAEQAKQDAEPSSDKPAAEETTPKAAKAQPKKAQSGKATPAKSGTGSAKAASTAKSGAKAPAKKATSGSKASGSDKPKPSGKAKQAEASGKAKQAEASGKATPEGKAGAQKGELKSEGSEQS